MDSSRRLIISRVAELGLSLSELSLAVGKNHAYFQQFIKRGVPRLLPEEVRGRVAKILSVDEGMLKVDDPNFLLADPKPNADYRGAVKMASSSSTATKCPKYLHRLAFRAFRMPMRSMWWAIRWSRAISLAKPY